MTSRATYQPGPARGARARRQGDRWTLVLVRDLRHPAEKVWRAITEPAHLREWAPFDADRNLDGAGPVKLTTVGTPTPLVSEVTIKRAEAPKLLEYTWGGSDLRWELEPLDGSSGWAGRGTRLTLWHNIGRKFIAMGAAGWHICFDVLDHHLMGDPIGRIVAREALEFDGWQRLNAEYGRQFATDDPADPTET